MTPTQIRKQLQERKRLDREREQRRDLQAASLFLSLAEDLRDK